MPAIGDEPVDGGADVAVRRDYDVLKQRVDLEVDFSTQSLRGSTEITLQPLVKDLRHIHLHCRQATPTLVQAGGITAQWQYDDAYKRGQISSSKANVHQHGMLKSRIENALRPIPEPQLIIALPPKLKIQELRVDPATRLPLYQGTPSIQKQESDAMALVESANGTQALLQGPQFAPIKLTIEFEVTHFRDGIHWVGCEETDKRYPHLFTKLQPFPGTASSIFPCFDDATSRCAWEIAIKCPRTLGDAFKKPRPKVEEQNAPGDVAPDEDVAMANGVEMAAKAKDNHTGTQNDFSIDLRAEDAALELSVLCIGEPSDDVADTEDDSRHTVTFVLNEAVTAKHVGFAIGPFEHVDLTMFRASEEETKLGQTAVKVDGYCLPGRSDELENTCFPICQAVDHISVNCGRFPFPTYQLLFIDDMVFDTAGAAGLTFCSNNLLFPQDILEPLDANTKTLIRAVADQWSGVNIVPKEPTDAWVVAGISSFLTDSFIKKLSGNNHYRWEQKLASEKVYNLDVDRPSISQHGLLLHLDPSIRAFMDLKSAVVLGILDRRLLKSSGSTGVMRIINKIFLNAKTGTLSNGELSTADFQKTCERLGHNKLDSFFRQWVMGAGCPIFHVSQRFNKKKLVVEMTIVQRQLERQTKPAFEPNNFMREVKEYVQEVWAPEIQPAFTGPMTIRIHEADGTPYEHIVEIKEPITKLEIPYNTKYKRLKRSRRAKERAVASSGAGGGEEDGSDALLYCLGDILDSPEEVKDWNLIDWSAEDEDKMGQESYEWIRMDADFEWIGKIHLVMPLYMYISQLQQDRDLVAQYESMRFLLGSNPHHVSLTILVRTLMDERYFYGIRVMATEGIAMLAKDVRDQPNNRLLAIGQHHLLKAFAHFFCDSENNAMPRPNDFTNRISFIMQCAIPQALAKLRDEDGKVPRIVQQFFIDKLSYNDNSENPFSDCHYISTLMACLADSLVASHREIMPSYEFNFGAEEATPEPENPDAPFEHEAVNVIERYRRLDEWTMTYQNVYSITAIECLEKLSKAGIIKDKTKELLQYTRASTAQNVRLQAFKCLNEMGWSRRPVMMKHLLYSLVDDPSPYFRDRMLKCFGEALGHIALGDVEIGKSTAPRPANDGALVLEEAASNETRRLEATRKTSPEGAIAALKVALSDDEVFTQALWFAATTPALTLDEIGALCDIAALIFDPVTSHTVTLKLPRSYRCVHRGKGKIHFIPRGNHRTTPSKGLDWDDYESLLSNGLSYHGPLSEDTTKRLADKANEEILKEQMARTQAELARLQSEEATRFLQQKQQMPPPPIITSLGPTSGQATPTEQKSGFKLSLGGVKRKASVDLGSQKDSSPKTIKLNKASTPGTAPKVELNTQGRSSTPISRAGKSQMITLDLGIAGSRKATEILSTLPQPGRSSSAQPPLKKIKLARQSSDAKQIANHSQASSAGLSRSPSISGSLTSPPPPPPPQSLTSYQPQNLNLGGFRSFGSADAAAAPTSLTGFAASPEAGSPAGFRSTSVDGNAAAPSMSPPPSLTGGGSSPHSLIGGITSLSSLSPDEKPISPAGGGGAMAPPPPKKKLTLKLGIKPGISTGASAPVTPAPLTPSGQGPLSGGE